MQNNAKINKNGGEGMQTISLKSNSPDTVIPILKNALERERRIIMDSLRTTKERINSLSEKLGIDIDKLMRGEVEHTESNEMVLIELEGEIEVLRHLEAELKELETLEICG
jgi:hypothetical protein